MVNTPEKKVYFKKKRKRRRSVLLPLQGILKRVYPAPDQLEQARLFHWWSRVVPEMVHSHARPVRHHLGILYVNVSNSTWAQELSYLSDDIRDKLRAAVPGIDLRAIRFRPGPLPDVTPIEEVKKNPRAPIKLAALPDEVARSLAAIRDDDLRKVVADAACHSLGELVVRKTKL